MRQITLASFTAAALFFGGCSSNTPKHTSELPPVPVTTQTAENKDITLYIESIGILSPSILSEIKPQASGKIQKVMVSEGDKVKEGSPLFEIDPKPYEIKRLEAEAQLAIDEAALKGFEKKLHRYQTLTNKNLIPQTEWDEMEVNADKGRGLVALSQARLQAAQLAIEECMISSPIEGVIGKLDTYPGMLVVGGQSTPLVQIAQMNPLLVEFKLTEKEFPQLMNQTQSIEMIPLCTTAMNKTGAVSFIDHHFDPKTGLVLIHAKVENNDYSLRPGQSVKVRIPVKIEKNALVIPQKAIRYNQEGPYIYVVKDDHTVALRPLVLGEEHLTDQIVLEGLAPNEIFVIEGHLRLSNDVKVDVKK